MHKQNKNSQGFTLVELLVVIAIIGLLSTLSIVALNNARMKARDAVRVSNIKQIQTALELYYNDAGQYTATNTDINTAPGTIRNKGTVFMGIVPTNPIPMADGGCAGVPYTYTYDNANSYHLTYCVGGTTGGISAGNHTATPSSITNP